MCAKPASPDPSLFLRTVRPALEAGDAERLARAVTARWRVSELGGLLRAADPVVRKVAAVVLGLVGDMRAAPWLVRALRDEDVEVNRMADHGLWSIWFRAGRPEAHKPFGEGMAALACEDYSAAVALLHRASRLDGDFAEAFDQCAIAHFLLGQWTPALADYREALRRVPYHHGAMAGAGHCFAQMEQLDEAIKCYRRALWINPHLTAIRRTVDRLTHHLSDGTAASMKTIVGPERILG